MPSLIEAYWPMLLAALLIGLAVAWFVLRANRKTRVTVDRRDVLDEGAAPAARNQALIDAAGIPEAQAEIGILAVHEEVQVKAREPVPQAPLEHQEAPGDDVDLTIVVPLPRPQPLRIEEAGSPPRGRGASRQAEHAPWCRPAPARRRIQPSVCEERAAPHDAGVMASELEQPVDGTVQDDRVGVEEQEGAASRPSSSVVVGAGEPQILLRRDDVDLGKLLRDRIGGAVGGRVVHDDDLVGDVPRLADHGGDTLERQRLRVVADDEDAQLERRRLEIGGRT